MGAGTIKLGYCFQDYTCSSPQHPWMYSSSGHWPKETELFLGLKIKYKKSFTGWIATDLASLSPFQHWEESLAAVCLPLHIEVGNSDQTALICLILLLISLKTNCRNKGKEDHGRRSIFRQLLYILKSYIIITSWNITDMDLIVKLQSITLNWGSIAATWENMPPRHNP